MRNRMAMMYLSSWSMLQLRACYSFSYTVRYSTQPYGTQWQSVCCGGPWSVVWIRFVVPPRGESPPCACESRPCLVYGVASNVKIVNQLEKLAWGLYCTVVCTRRARAYRIPPCTVQL